jgi:HNH endonuclease/NUMOD4 motif/Helix-turn-helix domain of resolvase
MKGTSKERAHHMTTEHWKSIQGTNYEVSDLGRVRNTKSGRILAPAYTLNGYAIVKLHGVNLLVHRLVLEAFAGGCPIGFEADHIDHNPKNNAFSNLRWITVAANRQNRRSHGPKKGSKKLTTTDQARIVAARAEGVTAAKVASIFDVSVDTVFRVCRKVA